MTVRQVTSEKPEVFSSRGLLLCQTPLPNAMMLFTEKFLLPWMQ